LDAAAVSASSVNDESSLGAIAVADPLEDADASPGAVTVAEPSGETALTLAILGAPGCYFSAAHGSTAA
jgi:hypothetical protein